MRAIQIEAWAIRIIERVRSKQPKEDDLVELKRAWPDEHWEAARRIAGHANAARQDPILWLIGVDEKANAITGADESEVSTWWAKVRSYFDGDVAPEMRGLNIPVPSEGKTVVALYFETERPPYVITSGPGGGKFQREVPWREATGIRSAKRYDLLRILVPQLRTPDIEVLAASLTVRQQQITNKLTQHNWTLHGELYVTPRSAERIVIPKHRNYCYIEVSNSLALLRLGLALEPRKNSATIIGAPNELLIDGPGVVRCSSVSKQQNHDLLSEVPKVQVVLHLEAVDTPPITINLPLARKEAGDAPDVIVSWRWNGGNSELLESTSSEGT